LLIEACNQAISRREEILQHLDMRETGETIRKARDLWVSYHPRQAEPEISGIDSSWNLIPYEGFFL
jgi:hypothetical protein